jgi:hypothetical protein
MIEENADESDGRNPVPKTDCRFLGAPNPIHSRILSFLFSSSRRWTRREELSQAGGSSCTESKGIWNSFRLRFSLLRPLHKARQRQRRKKAPSILYAAYPTHFWIPRAHQKRIPVALRRWCKDGPPGSAQLLAVPLPAPGTGVQSICSAPHAVDAARERQAPQWHSFKNRTGEWTSEVTGSLVHWSNRWLSWFDSDKKPLNLVNN